MKTRYSQTALLIGLLLFPASSALACDLCAIYSADQLQAGATEGFTLSVSEQVTGFHSLQQDGKHVENSAHQSMISSVTQFVGKYDFNKDLGLQAAVPLIYRDFKRIEGGAADKGSESGLGDISLIGVLTPIRHESADFIFRWQVRTGIKLPTGDTDRLKEETGEDSHTDETVVETPVEEAVADGEDHAAGEEIAAEEEHHHSAQLAHTGHDPVASGPASGIHGHDLTLGSGSVDYITGTGVFVGFGRYFTAADIQYVVRTEGDYGYRFQNDTIWNIAAGGYLSLEHDQSISLKANLSGEYKGMDVFEGAKAVDTGVNSMFFGPEVVFTANNSFFAQCGLDLPLFVDNTDLQIVPDYRVRASLNYRF